MWIVVGFVKALKASTERVRDCECDYREVDMLFQDDDCRGRISETNVSEGLSACIIKSPLITKRRVVAKERREYNFFQETDEGPEYENEDGST